MLSRRWLLLPLLLLPLNLLLPSTRKTVEWAPWAPPPYTSVPWQRVPESGDGRFFETTAVLVMTSAATTHLHAAQRRYWLQAFRHVWAFSDEQSVYTTTLPVLRGKSTYADAQHRQLRGMQWLASERLMPADVRWVLFVDDDTWVNTHILRRIVPLYDPSQPVICGYAYYPNGIFNGGAGILVSRPLFDAMAAHVYLETCPFTTANDNTITACALALFGNNLTIVHSSAFSFYPKRIESTNNFIEQATVHPVKDTLLVELMSATTNRFWAPARAAMPPYQLGCAQGFSSATRQQTLQDNVVAAVQSDCMGTLA
jgi:hypothetical protein